MFLLSGYPFTDLRGFYFFWGGYGYAVPTTILSEPEKGCGFVLEAGVLNSIAPDFSRSIYH
jgi:hypothetical protein